MIKKCVSLILFLGGVILFSPFISQAAIGITPPDSFVGDGTKDKGTSAAIQINIIDEEPDSYYLKAWFYPPNNAYARFGYVWHPDKQEWTSTWQKNEYQRQIIINETRNWQGEIKIKTDTEKTGYQGPGEYVLKIKASAVADNKTIEITKTVNIIELNQPPPESPPPIINDSTPPVTSPETTDTPTPSTPTNPNTIINELLPNPQGKDTEGEFIELKNLSDWEINLAGWQIKDKSEKTYTFNQEKIPANGFLVLTYSQSKITLNNTGSESLFLSNASGKIIDSVNYENCPEGQSYNLTNETWQWSLTSTPGTENIFTSQKTTEQDAAETAEKTEQDKQDETPVQENSSENNYNYKKYSNNVYINEFIPDPEGKDEDNEWLEIYNDDSETIDLSGWQIDDSNDGPPIFTLDEGAIIEPEQYLIFKRSETKIALNNTGDKLRLFYPNGDLAQEIEYFDSDEAWTIVRKGDGEYTWTNQPTPEEKNIISQKTIKTDSKKPIKIVVPALAKTYQAPSIEPEPPPNLPLIQGEKNNINPEPTTPSSQTPTTTQNKLNQAQQLAAAINGTRNVARHVPTNVIKIIILAILIAAASAFVLLILKRRLHH